MASASCTADKDEAVEFRQIGKGFCGSVWAADRPGPAWALKREDGGPLRSVLRDSASHQIIEQSLKHFQATAALATKLNIPQHRAMVLGNDQQWWNERYQRFPSNYEHCNTLITERILPVARPAREKLVDLFCHQKSQEAIKNSRKDEDCLIRPYIGRRRNHFSCPSPFFTLRNKPLLSNQLEELGLPVEEYAAVMADALAIIFWHSHLDANDVEFVLAPARAGESATESDVLGAHRLWVLDFDCVKSMTMDEQGIDQAAKAFFRNDPFYPRPDGEHENDHKLWRIFVERFLASSSVIIGDSKLPGTMVKRLEELGTERKYRAERIRRAEENDLAVS
ncbi:hypothetical protein HII31_11539 [Pseudocercospora fuligena]|uniref:DUF3669 domain-containing protein n=1 Tax=Pseudocercospora fuligena TaxID=685502 RepID=A0A8H6R9W0_9PEZI|nr:hypothetical protein HII31_11539 [Pseudocercospora fuligena]